MTCKIDRAFILAAGMGTRLRPYTDTLPKPLVPVAGKPIIDYALDSLAAAGVTKTTVNLHYRADLLQHHLEQRAAPKIVFSREDSLLDTGGGIKNALATMGGAPFYAVSGDAIWSDGPVPALLRLAELWDDRKMDLLLLFQRVSSMVLTQGRGDYDLAPEGHAIRSLDKTGAFMWTSIRICSPRLFDNTPEGPFSFLQLMDRAQAQGRLYALEHDADWHHISTPDDLERVNAHFSALKKSA